jgi:hypothetical protein
MQTDDSDIGARWMRHMRRGEWEAAWRLSDRVLRARAGRTCWHLPRHLQYVWDGRPLAGRRVLVRCYHGLGDTVQFIRLAQPLRRIAAEVIVWAQPVLLPLLRTARGIDRLLPLHDGSPDVAYDVDIEVMELAHALRIAPGDLPGEVPYLGCEAAATPAAGFPPGRAPQVGIVWQSGDWDPGRSVPLALVERLIEQTPALSWHVLQRGPALACWRSDRARIPPIDGMLDEARALRALDLLITVDTLSAHLAGALGVPTWTLLSPDPDWRWMESGERTPWYPSMRLWRQRAREGWGRVLERVRAALGGLARPLADQRSSPA